jgi:DNA-nicking Smr family endonuclease
VTRDLQPSEREVWNRVTRTVSPRRRPHGKQAAKPLPKQGPTREDFGAMMRLPPLKPTAPKALPPSVPRATDRLTRRGRVEIDARLDLHGLTQEQARRALATTLIRATKRGHRCVLVITGKGRNSGGDGQFMQGEGVLRAQLPHWLREPDLRPLVARLSEAHARHGGSGAWYVFLRA